MLPPIPILQREKTVRQRAVTDLAAFALAIDVPGKPASEAPDEWAFEPIETSVTAHHLLLLRAMQRTMETPNGRLMVFMPPGSAKSTYGSAVGPAWYLGRYPSRQVILASYGSDLARKHGRKTRAIVRQDRYRELFETKLSTDAHAADEWNLTNGSEYMAGGILSGMTGNRADGLVIDDPVKGREEAESETIRKRTKEAYEDDLRTRLKPSGWVILIQTRWHHEDLAGSILPESWDGESGDILCRDGLVWHVLCLQARCERKDDPLGRSIGEYLWREWFTDQHWLSYDPRLNPRANMRTWGSLYQQVPSLSEGTLFKAHWWNYYTEAPSSLNIYMTGDAAETPDGGDFSELAVWGVDSVSRVFVLDWWYGQVQTDEYVAQCMRLIRTWKPMYFIGEGDMIRKATMPFLRIKMREARCYTQLETLTTGGSKEAKAGAFAAMMENGMVYWPRMEWAERVRKQALKFPAGANDDAVDTCGVFGRFIDQTWRAVEPPPPAPTIQEAWQRNPTMAEMRAPRAAKEW